MEDKIEVNVDNKLPEQITVEYILKQVEAIRMDNAYLRKAVEDMNRMDEFTLPETCSNIQFVTKAEGWRDIVKARETTNQKMLNFYEKVYDDIKPKSGDVKQFIIDLVHNTNPGTDPLDYNAILSMIK